MYLVELECLFSLVFSYGDMIDQNLLQLSDFLVIPKTLFMYLILFILRTLKVRKAISCFTNEKRGSERWYINLSYIIRLGDSRKITPNWSFWLRCSAALLWNGGSIGECGQCVMAGTEYLWSSLKIFLEHWVDEKILIDHQDNRCWFWYVLSNFQSL